MDVVTILFTGLIAHVLCDSGQQRSVFIAAEQHVPRIVVASADVIDARGFPEQGSSRTERIFVIGDEHVVLHGTAPGSTLYDSAYRLSVPSLARLSGGAALIGEIERGERHPSAAAYLDLGGGTFTVADYYDKRVSLGSGRAPFCMARTVAFRTQPAGSYVEFRSESGSFVRVRSGATIRVQNDPLVPGAGSHFHMYGSILAGAPEIPEPESTEQTCSIAQSTARRSDRRLETHRGAPRADAVTPSCSDSQYP